MASVLHSFVISITSCSSSASRTIIFLTGRSHNENGDIMSGPNVSRSIAEVTKMLHLILDIKFCFQFMQALLPMKHFPADMEVHLWILTGISFANKSSYTSLLSTFSRCKRLILQKFSLIWYFRLNLSHIIGFTNEGLQPFLLSPFI